MPVEAFEGNNLIFVDEGHRGASSEANKWLGYRAKLAETGFTFEYSATFGQAINIVQDSDLLNEYSKSIIFDYSYKYFYGDGFGKDYQILNLEDDSNPEWMASYLTACLLAFFQQQRLHREREAAFRPFNLERPLSPAGRLSGHIVQGHVDGTGELVSLDSLGDENWWLRVRVPAELDPYLVFKGSIAIDRFSIDWTR